MDPRIVAGIIVVAVSALAAAARRPLAPRWLARLRVLVPAWRFFDRATRSPTLLVRHGAPGAPLGAWVSIHAPIQPPGPPPGPAPGPARATPAWRRWLIAPASNLALAYQAAVDQLVDALGELELASPAPAADADGLAIETDPAVTALPAYAVVDRIARAHAPARAAVQWKIVVPAGPDRDDDYLVAPVRAP